MSLFLSLPLVLLLGGLTPLVLAADAKGAVATLELFSVPPGSMDRLRRVLDKKDPSVQPAVDALLKEARKALTAKPVSVMDKPKPGASGDKHDYLSYAPYFWPDPSKTNGLPYIRKDGQRNPESHNEYSDSPRLGSVCKNASNLGLAYFVTGEEVFAEKAAQMLRVFFLEPETRMNPNFNQAQAVPGVNTGRGIGMIESRSLTGAADASALIQNSKHWPGKDANAFRKWLNDFVDWSISSKNGRDERAAKNNHGTYYDLQVGHLALFLGRTNLAAELIQFAMNDRLPGQIRPDGSQPLELDRVDSFGYSRFNLQAWFALATLAEHIQIDLWHYEAANGASLRKALGFLLPYVEDRQKPWPYDHGKKQNPSLGILLKQAARVYADPRYLRLYEAEPDPSKASHRDHLFLLQN